MRLWYLPDTVKTSSVNAELCYSARLLIPFVRVMLGRPDVHQGVRDSLKSLDPDERVPISAAHELLKVAVEMTGEPDLGLLAAREIHRGDYGAVEYAARSAANWGEVCGVMGRYMRLINDALQYSIYTDASRAFIQLQSSVELPRAAADFQSGAFMVGASQLWPSGANPTFEAWFTHERPAHIQAYTQTFPGGVLRFDAPFNGFVFDKNYLDTPVESADPQLHAVIRRHADALLAGLPDVPNVTARVRELLAKELLGGNPSADHIARQIPMGVRTLGRRLEQEGTSFKELLDDLRRRLALGYVAGSELALSEIALLLGFSQVAAFHRAFKRWTSQTPLEYRRAHHAEPQP